ncbi:MAG: hypothetical protein Q8N18_18115 [Opitutaceae bacterium]|nr:hypothetical protein [Opitutaceae bacterium]
MDAFATLASFALLLAGLLLPGAMLMRALRVPVTVATCFVGSAVALYVSVLALQICGVPISLATMAAGLALISAVAAGVSACRGSTNDPERRAGTPAATQMRTAWNLFGGWTPLYALFWIAVLLRVWHAPLNGPDIEFRWG